MFTIGQLAKRFSLSRSTLLYYDKVGLLHPSGRTKSNYRLYSGDDVERLTRINIFRQTGVPLDAIRTILSADSTKLRVILEARLLVINNQIAALLKQQHLIAKLLQDNDSLLRTSTLSKGDWVTLLRASGMTDEDMIRWHVEFERLNREAHHDFLCSLGISNAEIAEIQAHAQNNL